MSRAARIAVVVAALACAASSGGLVVYALGADEEVASTRSLAPAPATSDAPDVDDRPLEPREAARVGAAALRLTQGGTITEIDRSDDPGERYEVEVVRQGREIDVALDARLRRVPNVRHDGSGGDRPED